MGSRRRMEDFAVRKISEFASKSEVTEPEITEPEAMEPEATEPEATESETTESEGKEQPSKKDAKPQKPRPKPPVWREVVDQYGNVFMVANEELSKGGQGKVFRTKDADIAIKQPRDPVTDEIVGDPTTFARTIDALRLLPLPESVNVTMPLSFLVKEPGYTMKLLSGMAPVSSLIGEGWKDVGDKDVPSWLSLVSSTKAKSDFVHYAETGGLRRRLAVLHKAAAILARLHSAGIVYGDISDKNVFADGGIDPTVWLIDSDNMRLEVPCGKSVLTPGYGAPEVMTGRDSSRLRTDCWAFAVLAFKMLALVHPFRGKKVDCPDEEEDWADTPLEASLDAGNLEVRALAGEFPFIDDENDDSNASAGGLPRALVLTDGLRRLFQETFGPGRLTPWRRPPMLLWARELAWAFDHAVDCPGCHMGYYADRHSDCPFCHTRRIPCAKLQTACWEMVALTKRDSDFVLPYRLFHAYSPADLDKHGVLATFEQSRLVPAFGEDERFPSPVQTFMMEDVS